MPRTTLRSLFASSKAAAGCQQRRRRHNNNNNNNKRSLKEKVQAPLKFLSSRRCQPRLLISAESSRRLEQELEHEDHDDTEEVRSVSSTIDTLGSSSSSIALDDNDDDDNLHQALHEDGSKRVRFCLSLNETHANTTCDKHQVAQQQWYDRVDYVQFKQDRRDELGICQSVEREFADHPLSYQKLLEQAYTELCAAAADDDDDAVDQQQHHTTCAVSLLQPATQKHLTLWIQQTCASRLGLERTLVPTLVQDKVYRRKELLESVLDLQDEHQFVHNKRSHVAAKEQRLADELALTSDAFSRPARLLAQVLGQLQYEATLSAEEENDQEASSSSSL